MILSITLSLKKRHCAGGTREGQTQEATQESIFFNCVQENQLDVQRILSIIKYHTTNKCTNCMSFILNHFFKTLFTAPTCFDSISLIIVREHI